MFYKLGAQEALRTLGLLKASQTPPPAQPKAPPPPPPPKRNAPPIMGGGTKQVQTLRNEGVFL